VAKKNTDAGKKRRKWGLFHPCYGSGSGATKNQSGRRNGGWSSKGKMPLHHATKNCLATKQDREGSVAKQSGKRPRKKKAQKKTDGVHAGATPIEPELGCGGNHSQMLHGDKTSKGGSKQETAHVFLQMA